MVDRPRITRRTLEWRDPRAYNRIMPDKLYTLDHWAPVSSVMQTVIENVVSEQAH